MSRVLLVEDSDVCQLIVSSSLANANIDLSICGSYREMLDLVQRSGAAFDLAILDVVLPDGDGFKVLETLRNSGMSQETPVFFLTGESELNSKLMAFNLGADDYLVKPISPVELRARVEMRLRKSSLAAHAVPDVITRGGLVIDTNVLRASHQTAEEKVDLSLTAKEFKILAFLVQNENKVYSRSEIVEAVWGNGVHVLDRTVDSHIHGLRKKMGHLAPYVECIASAGYRFSLGKAEPGRPAKFAAS
jgi:DNA-binding response OmpR family regulator